jgi:putative ABC transport system permease protein
LLGLVTRTINDLYFVLSVRDVTLDPLVLAKGVLLGVGATLAAALAPAFEATGAPPRVVMSRGALETGARRMVPRATWLGLGLLASGGLILALPGGITAGFAGLFVLMIGCALVAPAAALGLLALLHPGAAAAFGTLGRLATRGIVASLSRTSVAIAALMIAVSAAIGVGIMIASFREAVVSWLEGTLRADVYVSAPSLMGNRPDATLDPALVARLAATSGVARAGTSRGVLVPGPGGPVQVVALDVDPARPPRWRFREGSADSVWAPGGDGVTGDRVIVSEPYANRHRARVGEAVRLRTDRGDREFWVGGVFYDYGSSAGVVVMSRRTYDRFWDDRGVSGVAIEAAPGTDLGALMTALRARAAGDQEIVVRSNRALREASGRLHRHARRAHGAPARARPRDRGAPDARPHSAPGVGARHRRDRADGAAGRRARGARGAHAGRDPRVRHQPSLVRLDHAHRSVARDPPPGGGAVGAGGGAGRALPRVENGARPARRRPPR